MAIEKMERQGPDRERVARLRELFPEVFSDGRVNLNRLREVLEGDADEVPVGEEHYGLYWPGKQEARQLVAQPPSGSLRRAPGEGLDEDRTGNLVLVGENLEVLRLLHKSYCARVKLVYIDPPYNTGEDFIYKDNFRDPVERYLEATGQADFTGLLTSNPRSSGRFHSQWLTFMYPRLALARSLLREDGFFVVSIDDTELANLRLLMDTLMGAENHLATLVWDRNRKNDARFFSVGHEYMVVYAKDKEKLNDLDTRLRIRKEGVEEVKSLFEKLRVQHNDNWEVIQAEIRSFYNSLSDDDPRKPLGRFNLVDDKGPYEKGNLSWPGPGGPKYEVLHPKTRRPAKVPSRGWVYPNEKRFWEAYEEGGIVFGPDETTTPRSCNRLFGHGAVEVMTSVLYSYSQVASQRFEAFFDKVRVFDNPKHFEDMAKLVEYLTGPDDLILDFFAGSGSTGHGVWLANHKTGGQRRFLLVQIDVPVNPDVPSGQNATSLGLRTIDAITRERLRRAAAQLKRDGASGDLGFRVLRLDKTHVQRWLQFDGDSATPLLDHIRTRTGLTPGYKRDNVLLEILLIEGYPLDSRCEQHPDFTENLVTAVNHPSLPTTLLVCLDDALTEDTVEALGAFKKDTFVCLDAALTDTLKVRVGDVIERVKTL